MTQKDLAHINKLIARLEALPDVLELRIKGVWEPLDEEEKNIVLSCYQDLDDLLNDLLAFINVKFPGRTDLIHSWNKIDFNPKIMGMNVATNSQEIISKNWKDGLWDFKALMKNIRREIIMLIENPVLTPTLSAMSGQSEKENEHTYYDKALQKFKNNKVIAIILIAVLIYVGISQLIQLTKENKENLHDLQSTDTSSAHYAKPSKELLKLKIDNVAAVDYGPDPEVKNITVRIKALPSSKDQFVPVKTKGELLLFKSSKYLNKYIFDLNTDEDGVKPQTISYVYLDGFIPLRQYNQILDEGDYSIQCVLHYDGDVHPGEQIFTSDTLAIHSFN